MKKGAIRVLLFEDISWLLPLSASELGFKPWILEAEKHLRCLQDVFR